MSTPRDNISTCAHEAQLLVSRADSELKARRKERSWRTNARRYSRCVSPLAPHLRAKQTASQPHLAANSGFTLLEIVVALAILGLSLTVLFGIFSQNVARTHLNETRAEERALANSLLMRAETADTVTDGAGRTGSGLVWRVAHTPFGSRDDEKNWPQAVSEITVTVARTGDPSTGVTLRTLKLAPKAPTQ